MDDTALLIMLEQYDGLIRKAGRDENFDLGDDDLRQEAALALVEALQVHNPERGTLSTCWINLCLKPRLRRWRAGCRFGVELDVDDAPVIAAQEEEDEKLPELTGEENAALDAMRDTSELAQRLGVTRRRAQQIVKASIQEIAAAVRARQGASCGQLGLGF